MGYYFECEYCSRVEPVDLHGDTPGLERYCVFCSSLICAMCSQGGLCEDCYDDVITEDNAEGAE